jgi:hypothetical protein
MPNNSDLTKDLLIDQLIKATTEMTTYLWEKKNYDTYFEYKFTSKIKETICIVFRIYRYKTHDRHTMNVYMSRKKDTVYVPMFVVDGDKLMELINCIEVSKKYRNIHLESLCWQ